VQRRAARFALDLKKPGLLKHFKYPKIMEHFNHQQKLDGMEHDETTKIRRMPIEGSLEVKLPTIWTDEKQSRAEAERRETLEERRVEEKESEERRCRCAKR